LGTVLSTLLSWRGVKRKSLSSSGAIAAWLVGFLSISCGEFLLGQNAKCQGRHVITGKIMMRLL